MSELWRVCIDCGDEMYPNADRDKMNGITVSLGTCERCGQENVTLVPISDYEYASGDDSKWD